MSKILKIKFPALFDYQREAITNRANYKMLAWGAQAGKTRLSIYAQAGFVIQSEGKTKDTNHLWVTRDGKFAREEHRLAKRLIPKELIEESNKSDLFHRLKNGATWWFYSGLEPDAFRGRSWHSAVFNEASYCKPSGWYDVVAPRLRGWVLFNFTPKGQRNFTFDLWKKAGNNPDSWFRSQVPTTENPSVNAEEIEKLRRVTSDASYRQEILAEFVSDFGQYFNPKEICWTGKFEPYVKGARYAAGLDWAEKNDFSALAIIRIDVLPRRLVYFARMKHMLYTEQIQPLAKKLKEYGNPQCYADASESTANQLMRQANCNVEDFNFTAQSKPFICDQLRATVEHGDLLLPILANATDEEQRRQCQFLRDEVDYFEPHFVGGRLYLGARGEHHDDILCAIMMANEKARVTVSGANDGWAYIPPTF